MTWPLPLLVIVALGALFIVGMFICAMFHRAIEQIDYELLDDASTYIDSYLESFIIDDETKDDEQCDAIPPDIASSLLECGIDMDRYQIDPNKPNHLHLKRVR